MNANINCAWIDEFNTNIAKVSDHETIPAIENYKTAHSLFIEKRIQNLNKEKIRRKGEIVRCDDIKTQSNITEEDIEYAYFNAIKQAIITKHMQHKELDTHSKKQVSFGVVRVANIAPCVALTEHLAKAEWSEDIDIRVMAYHSGQVLLLRNEQEKHLDEVLKRSDGNTPLSNPVIRKHLKQAKTKHVIFIVVATPVEEVGRDHDFDWAVIEPSSFRSFIQLAGRVLRHRKKLIETANIAIMQYNLKGLKKSEENVVFSKPGYERSEKEYHLSTHDLTKLVDEKMINKGIDAIPRISRNSNLRENHNLVDLEHFSIEKLLTLENKGADSMQGWLTECWWLTALPQALNPFREGNMQLKLFFVPNDGEFSFMEKNKDGKPASVDNLYCIEQKELPESVTKKLWLNLDYEKLLEEQADRLGNCSITEAALRYGEIPLPIYGDDLLKCKYQYSLQFGLSRLKNS